MDERVTLRSHLDRSALQTPHGAALGDVIKAIAGAGIELAAGKLLPERLVEQARAVVMLDGGGRGARFRAHPGIEQGETAHPRIVPRPPASPDPRRRSGDERVRRRWSRMPG